MTSTETEQDPILSDPTIMVALRERRDHPYTYVLHGYRRIWRTEPRFRLALMAPLAIIAGTGSVGDAFRAAWEGTIPFKVPICFTITIILIPFLLKWKKQLEQQPRHP